MITDIAIAQAAKPKPIGEIARALGLPDDAVVPYGRGKAKVDTALLPKNTAQGKLVLVTAINPTPAGEGKTTVSIGLADALRAQGVGAVLALREPSLGPVFGMKGGATGGGYAQVLPMEDINLHFTGDLHAITAANNLLSALIDNHIAQGNALEIDVRRVVWRRCMDMNDRQLRQIACGLGGKANGVPREDGFDITAASEVMATFCLAENLADLKARLARLVVAYTHAGKPVTAGDLRAQGAMCALLRDAFMPNLAQTLYHTPALIHGGPFANIAHGCNSVAATRLALSLGDVCVTEAGFGGELGAEKFIDIKCRMAGLSPACVVVVATVRALKSHGGAKKEDLGTEDLRALAKGIPNLLHHVQNITGLWKLPAVVALNAFSSDTQEEIRAVREACELLGVPVCLCESWGKGPEGGRELARAVIDQLQTASQLCYSYELELPLKKKIEALCTRVYGAAGVAFGAGVTAQLTQLEKQGYGGLPVCMVKTQYSLSDDPKKVGRPTGFTMTVRDVRLSAGAGFVVVFAGDLIAMPGLPKTPAAQEIDVDGDGRITGLF